LSVVVELDPNGEIIGYIEDKENTVCEITRERHTSRMIAYNDAGEIAILELRGKDEYNLIREHLETPGGKFEAHETPELAVIREAIEELGAKVEIQNKLGIVIDINYFLKARTFSHYFEVKIKEFTSQNWTPIEKQLIHEIKWFTLDEARNNYESYRVTGMGKHIHARDMLALNKLHSVRAECLRKS
jgi:8-oxo-dGTP pyrophosphatase MutT (NUDIX family)